MRLINADELRATLLANHYLAEGFVICTIESAPTVDAPEPLTRDGVLAEVARIEAAGDTAVVEIQFSHSGVWAEVELGWVKRWTNPDVPRWNVRVRVVPAATEWVPLTRLVGRTPVGHNIPVRTVQYRRNPDGWIWDGGGEHCGSHLPVDLDSGRVEVLAEGDA